VALLSETEGEALPRSTVTEVTPMTLPENRTEANGFAGHPRPFATGVVQQALRTC